MHPLALLAGFALAALLVYAPALSGAFISDDEHYVQRNVFVHEPLENLGAILDPTSVLAVIVENYAPVHVLLHAAEWQLFGTETTGYHVVNALVHALAAFLLVLLFRRTGIGALPAALGGAFFLVHPGNVEAVAWINQLKTSSAMALALAGVLAHPRRPALGAVLFALALMAKPTAAVALFFVAVWGWMRAGSREAGSPAEVSEGGDWRWVWLGAWALILVLFAIAEFAAFGQTAAQAPPLYAELDTRLRSIPAIGLRYLAMATSSYGLSAFHEPDPADSFADPWFLLSLPVLAALGWRTVACLRTRRVEAAWWIWALVSFGPICGVIPLPFPMADRYLYFILPGLIGGVLLTGAGWWERMPGTSVPRARQLATATAALLLVVFALRSWDRAHVWQSPETVMFDVEENYPDGTAAKTRLATRAAMGGDARTAVAALEAAHARGYNRLDHLLMQPYEPISGDPDFVALKKRWAREWLARLDANESPSQHELRLVAQAHIVLGDLPAALRAVERGLERDGPIREALEQDREMLEREIRFSRVRR